MSDLFMFHCVKKALDLGQYDRPTVLGCEPVDGVLVVLSSNQLNIAKFVNTHVFHLMNKSGNIYLHPSTLGLSYWPKFLVNKIVKNIMKLT